MGAGGSQNGEGNEGFDQAVVKALQDFFLFTLMFWRMKTKNMHRDRLLNLLSLSPTTQTA